MLLPGDGDPAERVERNAVAVTSRTRPHFGWQRLLQIPELLRHMQEADGKTCRQHTRVEPISSHTVLGSTLSTGDPSLFDTPSATDAAVAVGTITGELEMIAKLFP